MDIQGSTILQWYKWTIGSWTHRGWLLRTPCWVKAARHVHTHRDTQRGPTLWGHGYQVTQQAELMRCDTSQHSATSGWAWACAMVESGHEWSFLEESHFLPSHLGGGDRNLFLLWKLIKLDTHCALFCVFCYKKNSPQIEGKWLPRGC